MNWDPRNVRVDVWPLDPRYARSMGIELQRAVAESINRPGLIPEGSVHEGDAVTPQLLIRPMVERAPSAVGDESHDGIVRLLGGDK